MEKTFIFVLYRPCLFKYIIVDTDAFLAKPERVVKLLHMCSHVMRDTECGDDIRAGAVKILEVMITQCQGRLNQYIGDIIALLMQYFSQPQEDFDEFETQLAIVSFNVCEKLLN